MQLFGDILAYAELGTGVFAQLAAGFNVLCGHGADDRHHHMRHVFHGFCRKMQHGIKRLGAVFRVTYRIVLFGGRRI